MKRLNSKKALEVAAQLQSETEEVIVIYKGNWENRFRKVKYMAFMKTMDGYEAAGTFGHLYRYSDTLKGLLNQED